MKRALPEFSFLLIAALSLFAGDDKGLPNSTPVIRRMPTLTGRHIVNDRQKLAAVQKLLQLAPATGNGINYHGGPVMNSTITLYYIWYGNWNGNTAVALLENFAQNIGGTPYFNTVTTYSDNTDIPVQNKLLFGGSTTDNYSQGKSLTDEQVLAAVSLALSSGKLPTDLNGVYFVLSSADVTESTGFCSRYCGWHTYNPQGPDIKYAFVGNADQCPSSCSGQSASPNANVGADAMASVIAHELVESATDPTFAGWYDADGDEAADKCAWNFGTTFNTPNGAKANVTLGGYNYLIQELWLNANGGSCVLAYGAPSLTGISPASGSPGASVPITLSGNAFDSGASLSISGAGVTASNIAVANATQMTATLNVAQSAAPGSYDIAVTTGAGTSAPVTFTLGGPAPALASVTPASGWPGTTVPVSLTGTNFGSTATVVVSGSGITVSGLSIVNATQITANLVIAAGAAPGIRSVAVAMGNATSASILFTVATPPATLTAISPASGIAGSTTPVTLTGTNFASGNTVAVSGGGVSITGLTIVSATQMTAQFVVSPTASTGARSVTVSTGSATSSAVTFTIVAAPPPTLISISPATIAPGSSAQVTLTGSNFASGATISVSGSLIAVTNTTVVSPTQLTALFTVDSAAAAGTRSVSVTSGSVTTAAVSLTIPAPPQAAPAISSISPASGVQGTTIQVTVSGSNFTTGDTINSGGTGLTVSNVTVLSATQLTFQMSIASSAATGAHPISVLAGSVANGSASAPVVFTVAGMPTAGGLAFYPITPCRIADTRVPAGFSGQFGPPSMPGGQTRSFSILSSPCAAGIPSTVAAYALNFTAAPPSGGPPGNLTTWPTGATAMPNVSTLNYSGGVVANAAIVPAGSNGAINVYVNFPTDVLFDITGYFAPPTSAGLEFYALTPCRIADTRPPGGFSGAFGPPSLSGGSTRTFNIPASGCGVPSTASAYALNFTVVPPSIGPEANLTTWPATQSAMPNVSTLNYSAAVVANAAIVPAGSNEAIAVFVNYPTDILFDINGYFAPPASSGLHYYPVTPCRVADTRPPAGFSGQFGPPTMTGGSTRTFNIPASGCGIPSTAVAYALNFTVAPQSGGPAANLTTWPTGAASMPNVSTLNYYGNVVANAAIVPAGANGAINVFVNYTTDLLFDINGYFAP